MVWIWMPRETTKPTNPTNPTNRPTNPTNPTETTSTTNPTEPTNPTNPTNTTHPADQPEKTKPTRPNRPTRPTRPTRTTRPGRIMNHRALSTNERIQHQEVRLGIASGTIEKFQRWKYGSSPHVGRTWMGSSKALSALERQLSVGRLRVLRGLHQQSPRATTFRSPRQDGQHIW